MFKKSVRIYSAALATFLATGLMASPAPAIAGTPGNEQCLVDGGRGIKTCGGIQVEVTQFGQQRCDTFSCHYDLSFAMRTRMVPTANFIVTGGYAMSVNPYACLQIPQTPGVWTSWCTISTTGFPQYIGIDSRTIPRR